MEQATVRTVCLLGRPDICISPVISEEWQSIHKDVPRWLGMTKAVSWNSFTQYCLTALLWIAGQHESVEHAGYQTVGVLYPNETQYSNFDYVAGPNTGQHDFFRGMTLHTSGCLRSCRQLRRVAMQREQYSCWLVTRCHTILGMHDLNASDAYNTSSMRQEHPAA